MWPKLGGFWANSLKPGGMTLTSKILPLILVGTLVAIVTGFSVLLNEFDSISSDQIKLSRELLTTEQVLSKDTQLKALESKANTLGNFMSAVAVDLIFSSDFEALVSYKNNAESDPDISYATFTDPEKKSFVTFKKPDSTHDSFEKTFKIVSDGDLLGYVLLGVSKDQMNASIAASDTRISKAVVRVEKNARLGYTAFLYIIGVIVVGITLMVIASVYFSFQKLIISRLKYTTELMNELSQGSGDLTKRLPVSNSDEISDLCGSVNKFVEKLQDMIIKIAGNVHKLSDESSSLENQGKSLSEHALVQSEEAATTASSVVEMAGSMQEVFDSSESAETMARKADSEAHEGTKVVNETISAITVLSSEITETSTVINLLQDDSEKIGGVLEVIRGIAEQTNLLALNAAIEAARAGDQGRGFAVVADEVRTLASRTQTATEEINEMIENLQAGSKKAVAAMLKSTESAGLTAEQAQLADTSLKNIVEAVKSISEMNSQIATAAQEQKIVADAVDGSVSKINYTSQETAESAQNTADISVTLSGLAHDLKEMIGQFKT